MRKLRILCLHGYHGTAEILRQQAAPLLSGLPAEYEFIYVDAPSLSENDFGWWHLNFRGWQRTLAWAADYFAGHGPFDGVFGFSQGAALTSLLVGLRATGGQPGEQRPLRFGFAIMAGGFTCDSPDFAGLYAAGESYRLPSLHIMGQSDGVVPAADSRALAAQFDSPVVLLHPGGHVVASTPPVRREVARFLAERAAAQNVAGSLGLPATPGYPGIGQARPASRRTRRRSPRTGCSPAATTTPAASPAGRKSPTSPSTGRSRRCPAYSARDRMPAGRRPRRPAAADSVLRKYTRELGLNRAERVAGREAGATDRRNLSG